MPDPRHPIRQRLALLADRLHFWLLPLARDDLERRRALLALVLQSRRGDRG